MISHSLLKLCRRAAAMSGPASICVLLTLSGAPLKADIGGTLQFTFENASVNAAAITGSFVYDYATQEFSDVNIQVAQDGTFAPESYTGQGIFALGGYDSLNTGNIQLQFYGQSYVVNELFGNYDSALSTGIGVINFTGGDVYFPSSGDQGPVSGQLEFSAVPEPASSRYSA
jgi:hypothetical protein